MEVGTRGSYIVKQGHRSKLNGIKEKEKRKERKGEDGGEGTEELKEEHQ